MSSLRGLLPQRSSAYRGKLGFTLSPIGIASAEAFGTASISLGPITISPTGIMSFEAFGIAVFTGGIPSGAQQKDNFMFMWYNVYDK